LKLRGGREGPYAVAATPEGSRKFPRAEQPSADGAARPSSSPRVPILSGPAAHSRECHC